MNRNKVFTLLILFVFIITSGFACQWSITKPKEFKPITLEYWGVWDTPSQLKSLIDSYEVSHPTIHVKYRNFRYDEYEGKLLEAWADDRGPDIFSIPSTWLKEYQHRLEPMPASVKIPVQEITGTIKKEAITSLKQIKSLSSLDIKEKYAPIVSENVIIDSEIYGLPYYLDTLVTFYNSDLLTRENIPEPIADFHDLVEQAPQLTKATEDNQVIQSAVALGGTDNIPRFFDVFSSIMLQNNVEAKGKWFAPLEEKESASRLLEVFSFYTDFARPGRATYSWNVDLPSAFELFAAGKLAYFFGYSYHADELRQRGVQFDWGITNFPQTRGASGTKYYADYWVNVVAKKSANSDAAWNFIQTTANQAIVEKYLTENKRPTALRSLINDQLNNEDVRVFASQVLTADNWYNGYDVQLAENYLKEIIDDLVSSEKILDKDNATLNLFVNFINQTYQQPNE